MASGTRSVTIARPWTVAGTDSFSSDSSPMKTSSCGAGGGTNGKGSGGAKGSGTPKHRRGAGDNLAGKSGGGAFQRRPPVGAAIGRRRKKQHVTR